RCDGRPPYSDKLERTAAPQGPARPRLLVRRRRPGRGVVVGKDDMKTLDRVCNPGPSAEAMAASRRGRDLAPYRTRHMVREVGADGICTLTFDRANSSANIFDRDTLLEL